MKIWRAVTFASLAVLALGLALILSTPLRFPGYIIVPYGPVLTFLIPGFITCGLLVSRLALAHRPFAIALVAAGSGYALLTIAGAMAPVVFVPSLGVLALMYTVSKRICAPHGSSDMATTILP